MPELTSFVYSGAPFSDAGFQFQVEPMTQTTANFSVLDTTTNTPFQSNGTPYSGPVAGLQSELIDAASDNLNVTADVPNVFIHTGSGEDAIDVSHAGGNNVLDGSTGSNFLVGGSGDDTFFVDDRSPSADIWSTVSDFHAGDAATIFGITQNGFATSWVDGQGATGFTGLTLHVTAPGVPTASLTLAGFSMADLSDGRISTSFGTESDGTPYLYVYANSSATSMATSMSTAMVTPMGGGY
jgi:Ca2+-binding RTX toxin-like protein